MAGALASLWMMERLNQLEVLLVRDCSECSRIDSWADCFRLSILDDFGLSGSVASLRYSWARACDAVGRAFGSHMRHQVTKWLRDAGHAGWRSIVSKECGAICAISFYQDQ
jgi:hypothetical protein